MELNKQQKTGMVIAALAVAALGVDRFALGGGGPATASAQAVLPDAIETASPQAVAAKSGITFAQQLERFAESNNIDPEAGVPNVFGDDAEWAVTAVIGNGQRGAVRIGTKLIRVGQAYEDAVLVRVDGAGGIFAKAGREFRVPLDHSLSRNGR